MPRVYLAWPSEVAAKLKEAKGGRGDTILFDLPVKNSANAAVSPDWVLTIERVGLFLETKLGS
jgi:hypothetical protein